MVCFRKNRILPKFSILASTVQGAHDCEHTNAKRDLGATALMNPATLMKVPREVVLFVSINHEKMALEYDSEHLIGSQNDEKCIEPGLRDRVTQECI